MQTNLDIYDILNWMDGCRIGSHLRQDIWQRAVDEFYHKLNDLQRNTIFHFAVRDFWDTYTDERFPHYAKDYFLRFVARFNPNNVWEINTPDGEMWDCFKYESKYYWQFHSYIVNGEMVSKTMKQERYQLYLDKFGHCLSDIDGKVNLDLR